MRHEVHLSSELVRFSYAASRLMILTNSLHVSTGIEILENQNVVFALLAHIVELLRRVVHQIHHGAGIMSSDMVCFHEILMIHGASIADCKGPIFDRCY